MGDDLVNVRFLNNHDDADKDDDYDENDAAGDV